jgi:hypothetical protein
MGCFNPVMGLAGQAFIYQITRLAKDFNIWE